MLYKTIQFIIGILVVAYPLNLAGQQLNAVDQEKVNFHLTSAEEYKKNGQLSLATNYYNKAAYIYWEREINVKAIEYFSESLEINKQIGNNNAVKGLHFNIGLLHSEIGQFSQATSHLQQGIQLSKQLEQRQSIASGYLNLGMVQKNAGQYNQAIENLQKALQIYMEEDNIKFIRTCYGSIAETYEKMGNTEKMVEFFDKFSLIDQKIKYEQIKDMEEKTKIEIDKAWSETEQTQVELDAQKQRLKATKDSLEKAEMIAEQQKMELQIKELEIAESEAQLRSRRMLIYGLLGILAIISVFVGVLVKLMANIKKANTLLDAQNKQITESIHYARRIQNALLPLHENLSKDYQSFIIYRPKDIVSGDFYWYSEVEENGAHPQKMTFIAAVDCTGHGVPGAFMSMIGNSLLNEIVNEMKTYEPANILEILDNEVRNALKQDKTENNDGMDVCLCKLENITSSETKITYCGAKRPLLIYKKEKNEVEILEGDRKSIGGTNVRKMDIPFTNQESIIKNGDVIYLSSDGIIDQNSYDRKRFGSKRLVELLKKHAVKDMEEQKNIIETTLENHMENVPQRDDITVLGIKKI